MYSPIHMSCTYVFYPMINFGVGLAWYSCQQSNLVKQLEPSYHSTYHSSTFDFPQGFKIHNSLDYSLNDIWIQKGEMEIAACLP